MNKQHSSGLLGGIWARAMQRWFALYHLLVAAWAEYEHDRANYLAAAMIYYALVSLVPLLVLMLSALGLLLRYSPLAAEWQQQVLGRVEASFGPELSATIEQSLISFQQGSIVASVVGVVVLLFTASVLFRHLRLSFRALWKYAPVNVSGSVRVVVQTTLRERIVSFVMVLVGGVLLVAALILAATTRWLNTLFNDLPLIDLTTAWLLAELSPLLLVALTFALLFTFLPPARLGWRDIWLATLFCTLGWGIASKLFELYGVFFGGSTSAYGVLGALLVAMLWMNIVSQLLFFGGELCKVVATQQEGSANERE